MTASRAVGTLGDLIARLAAAPALALALAAALASASPAEAQVSEKPPEAPPRAPLVVAAFKDLSSGTERLGEAAAQAIMAGLDGCGNIRPLEREELDKILAEMELGMSGLVDEASAARAGRLVGARFMVFGAVAQVGAVCQVTWRLIGVETGEQLGAGKVRGTKAELLDMADRVALDLDKAVGAVGAKTEK